MLPFWVPYWDQYSLFTSVWNTEKLVTYMSPPAFSTVFPIHRILYSIKHREVNELNNDWQTFYLNFLCQFQNSYAAEGVECVKSILGTGFKIQNYVIFSTGFKCQQHKFLLAQGAKSKWTSLFTSADTVGIRKSDCCVFW